jgi:predicted RNA-binding protein with PUA-like domain
VSSPRKLRADSTPEFAVKYWLMKTEPEEFSIDDLERVGSEPWSGVRNYQARNHMRAMRRGDGVLFYHSSCAIPGVAGVAEVAVEAYPDPTQFERKSDYYDPKSTREAPRWDLVDVAFKRKLARVIALDDIKQHAERLGDFALTQRGNRLSVLPVTAAQWKLILSLE